jgi:hypothetical protein
VLASGSWIATTPDIGSLVVESVFPESRDVRARSSLLLGSGSITTTFMRDLDGDILRTELTRSGEGRPVFRLALDRPLSNVQARVRPGGSRSSLTVCSNYPVRPLFEKGRTTASVRADFESEPYFGAGWGDAERTGAGQVRHGEAGATLFLPLEQGWAYRASIDLASPETGALDVTLNGLQVGVCDLHSGRPCEIALPAAAVVPGINTLMLMPPGGEPMPGRGVFTFRGARIAMVR